ncbi:toprim domain-containing protein [Saccharothrix sp. HUAS TT1]|uniref:toprim domain-containing protein n=1 Tax=unclassified Saccharothrix TaxID=2593673 RepID=UPI00345BF39C
MIGSPAEEYLASRGFLSLNASGKLERFRLGYVSDPLPGHQMYAGWLAIPYLRWSPGQKWSVVTMRFRCLRDHDHDEHGGKFMSHTGGGVRLFNTISMLGEHDEIAICEGEPDTITAELCGIPAVGVPGVQTWRPYFRRLFLGFRKVFVLADGDKPGMEFARKVESSLPNALIVPMDDREDVSSTVQVQGPSVLLERMGR